MSGIHLINLASVGIFGIILSIEFCNIYWTRQRYTILSGGLAVILMLQGIVYFFVDPFLVEYFYPIITHIPLVGLLCILSRKYLWSVISVLTAYFCCQIRRWLALFITAVFAGDLAMQNITELILTLPLLLLLMRFAAPSVRSVSQYAVSVQFQFGLVPAIYYGFDYLTRIYTSLFSEGALVVVEFMPFICCVAYLFFLLYITNAEQIRSQLEKTQDSLNIQVSQAVREIESLRESQQKVRTYRHDMRHHMQFLFSCIENGKTEQAKTYIREVCSEIEANQIIVFCENETANLIFSAFAGRAGKYGIPIKIEAVIPQTLSMSENDLCVLLSNALENALHACQQLKKKGITGNIEVSAYEKREKLLLQITNSCGADLMFAHGVPVTDRPGHGTGVRSICAVVEKYGGIYTFLARDGRFTLRVSL